jgi:hypothetical protein
MRRPRIEDYDPNAKLPELTSPIDGMPVIGEPPQKSNGVSPTSLPEKPVIQEEQVKQAKQKGTPDLAPKADASKRPVKPRHGFDIYWDQYEALLTWSNEEKLQGGTGSMSAMAREALDDYIAKRRANNH